MHIQPSGINHGDVMAFMQIYNMFKSCTCISFSYWLEFKSITGFNTTVLFSTMAFNTCTVIMAIEDMTTHVHQGGS